MSRQLALFEIETTRRPDGAFLVIPRRPAELDEGTVAEACEILGRGREFVYGLLECGKIRGWRGAAPRAKWAVDLGSVRAYKAARYDEAAAGPSFS